MVKAFYFVIMVLFVIGCNAPEPEKSVVAKDIEQALQFLNSADPKQQQSALSFLLQQPDKSLATLERLGQIIKDSAIDSSIKGQAVLVASYFGELALESLVAAANNPAVNVRSLAAKAMRKTGAVAIPTLCKLATDDDEDVRSEAIEALGVVGNESSLVVVMQGLQEKKWQIRKSAVDALSNKNFADRTDVALALAELLKDKDWRVRMSAAEALGHINQHSDQSFSATILAIQDEDQRVFDNAMSSVKQLSTKKLLLTVSSEAIDTILAISEDESLNEIVANYLQQWVLNQNAPTLLTQIKKQPAQAKKSLQQILTKLAEQPNLKSSIAAFLEATQY